MLAEHAYEQSHIPGARIAFLFSFLSCVCTFTYVWAHIDVQVHGNMRVHAYGGQGLLLGTFLLLPLCSFEAASLHQTRTLLLQLVSLASLLWQSPVSAFQGWN